MIIPFFIPHAGCPHQCVFCNQKHISGHDSAPEPSSLALTIRHYLDGRKNTGRVEVAFFGGSFTALHKERQRAYLQEVQPFVSSGEINDIRLSTRPDCITGEILDLLEEYHVGIVELGAQSLDDTVLSASGRGHRASDTEHAARLLHQRGFAIGLQLMPGLPGDSAERFTGTVEKTIRINPDFVRLYPTLVVKDTPLAQLYEEGRYLPLPLPEAVAWCSAALAAFRDAGIRVIRVGLQTTDALLQPGAILAGPFHHAFGQLVESELYLGKLRLLLASRENRSHTAVIAVHRQDVSTAIGQRRKNIEILRREFNLRELVIRADETIANRGAPLLFSGR